MSAQEFESLKAFKSWVLENKNKLWQYNYFMDDFQRKNQGNIFTPKVGQIYVIAFSPKHMDILFVTKVKEMEWDEPDYSIEYYYCQLTISKKFDLVVSYKSHESSYWNRNYKGKYNIFVYNPNSFNFLNWNQDLFEVKS